MIVYYVMTCTLAGQLVVIAGTSETVSGSAAGEGQGTLDLPHSTLFFAGVPHSVYTSRSVILHLSLKQLIVDDCQYCT